MSVTLVHSGKWSKVRQHKKHWQKWWKSSSNVAIVRISICENIPLCTCLLRARITWIRDAISQINLWRSQLLNMSIFFLCRHSMAYGPLPSFAWQSSRLVPFCPTPVVSWQVICQPLQYFTFCSFQTIIHWSTSSLTQLALSWQSSPCFCYSAWNAQVRNYWSISKNQFNKNINVVS